MQKGIPYFTIHIIILLLKFQLDERIKSSRIIICNDLCKNILIIYMLSRMADKMKKSGDNTLVNFLLQPRI